MSAAFSWRDQVIPQTLQQQRGSQFVPPGAAPGDKAFAHLGKKSTGRRAQDKASSETTPSGSATERAKVS